MPGVLISMIGCGRRDGTRKCLEKALRTAPTAQFILTDNGSKDGTGQMFQEVAQHRPNVRIFLETENTGFIAPGNRAFRLSVERGCDFTILLNDDTDPPEGWLERLLEPFADPLVALTCPEGTCCTLDQDFAGSGGRNFEYCEGSCLAIRNSAIQSFSKTLFDENLSGIYGDDSNLSLRAREKGWKIARAAFEMPHIRSATTRAPEVKAYCDFHQKRNHDYNVKRWSPYLRFRRFDFPILLKRSYAIGDVLLMTPIIRALAKAMPQSPIFVETDYPQLFDHNPHVQAAAKRWELEDGITISLDGSYENLPMTHIVHAYEAVTREAFPGMGPVELRTELHPSKEDIEWARQIRSEKAGEKKLALIGSDLTTWIGKNWPQERFSTLRHDLERKGWKTLSVGSKRPEVATTLGQLAALCSVSQLFVGLDSFPMHAAQAVGCPVVGIFGATSPRFILTQGSRASAAVADPSIHCAGERHRTSGLTYVPCNGACIRSVTVESVWRAIERLQVL